MTARKTTEQYILELDERYGKGKVVPLEPYQTRNTPIKHHIVELDEIWEKTPNNLLCERKHITDPRVKTHEQYVKDLKNLYGSSVKVLEKYKKSQIPIKHKSKNGGVFYESPNRMLNGWVESKVQGVHPNKLSDDDFKEIVRNSTKGKLQPVEKYKGSKHSHSFKCKCGRICKYRLDIIRRDKPTCCQICSKSQRFSKKAIRWIKWLERRLEIQIRHALNSKFGEKSLRLCDGKKYKVDGYYAPAKLVFEFNGDVYHGNPKVYNKKDKCHPFNREITAGDLYRRTQSKEKLIRDSGFKLITIWGKMDRTKEYLGKRALTSNQENFK